jgi:hypothetical protein
MSRVFTNTTGQMLQYVGSMGITARPVTLFMWVKFVTSLAGSKMLAYNNVSGSYIDIDISATKIRTTATQSSGGSASTTATPSADVWIPVIGIYDGSGVVNTYALTESVAGGNAGTFNAESSPNFCIGNDSRQPAVANINGKIAHVTMWSTALSAGDRTSLLGGAIPSGISSGSLIEYWALTDASLTGVNGRVLAVTGTVNSDTGDNPTVGGGTVTGTGALAAQSATMAGTATTFQVVTGAGIIIDSTSMFLNLDFPPVDGDKVGISRDWLGSALTLAATGTFTITPALPNGTEIPRISYDDSTATWYEDVVTINQSGALTIFGTGALQAQSATMAGTGTAGPPINTDRPPKGGRVFHRLRTR